MSRLFANIIFIYFYQRCVTVKKRKLPLGNMNITGAKIMEIRLKKGTNQKDFIAMLQTNNIDINPTSYSKLEGQTRQITDKEIYAVSKILNVPVDELFSES